MNRKTANILGSSFGLALFLAALWSLHYELAEYHYRDIAAEAHAVPSLRLFAALLLTALNYLVLTGYDVLSFRYIHNSLSYGKIAFASFIGYAFSNNMGLSLLAGSSVRYRLYTAWGISIFDITKMVAFNALMLWLGLLSLGGITFIIEPLTIPTLMKLPFASARPLGFIFLALVVGYVGLSFLWRKPITIRDREFVLPSTGLSLAQVAISSIDWMLAGSVLYVLLPETWELSLFAFYGIFLLAQLAGLASQIPGGLGVFETVFILLSPPEITVPQKIGALLLYRGIYYLLPLIIAAAMMGIHEMARAKTQAAFFVRFMGQGATAIAPRVLSVIIFIGGSLLLISGATPELTKRLEWISEIMPLPFLEISHFLSSLVGVALLLLSRGIQRRLDAAYHLTLILLGAGILFSLAKGFDYEEALILAIMFGALLPGRNLFYRRSSLMHQSFSPGWIAAIMAVIAGTIWLGFFSYRHVTYSRDLWWQFAIMGDAPRFLRATVGVISLAVLMGLLRLMRPAPPVPSAPSSIDMDKARAVVLASRDTTAFLGLLGDKRFLFSDSGNSFIMYGVAGRSWVAMGDPVGREEEWKDLVWHFRELCDHQGGWPVFYEVGKENLYLYIDLGLTPLKIGEKASVMLTDFSLEGSRRKNLRHTHMSTKREDIEFTLVPAVDVPPLLAELRSISEAWLTAKNTREKRFSLGYFNESYLRELPIALARKDGKIVAFCNIWQGADKEEISIDLMRQIPGSSYGIMEFLFVELMLWGKEQGYRKFNLGMVPLAGLEDRALAPIWNRLGAQIFRHGEHFYNFRGLRQFKEHFGPEWEPKYLVFPRGFLLPRIFANLASLISGGFMGALRK